MVINKEGTKEFEYTSEGLNKAREYAKETGGRIVHHQDDSRKELKK
jgi:hypothetical protein